jgi:hypothetical protein
VWLTREREARVLTGTTTKASDPGGVGRLRLERMTGFEPATLTLAR